MSKSKKSSQAAVSDDDDCDYQYPFETYREYAKYLTDLEHMALVDHAIQVGVSASGTRQQIVQRLEEEYQWAFGSQSGPPIATPKKRVEKAVVTPVEAIEATPIVESPAEIAQAKPVETKSCKLKTVPKWRVLVNKMVEEGITYNAYFTTEQLERDLGMERDSAAFAFAIASIRHVLMGCGMYLTSRGMKGQQFMVMPANRNADVMQSFSSRASAILMNGITLGSNTDRTHLNDEETRRHNSMLEKLAHKSVLMKRSDSAWKALDTSPEGKKLIASETIPVV